MALPNNRFAVLSDEVTSNADLDEEEMCKVDTEEVPANPFGNRGVFSDKERDGALKEENFNLFSKPKQRRCQTSDKPVDGSVISNGRLDHGDDKKQKGVRPNYFVAIQVCSPEIHKALNDVQQTVMARYEKLKDAMVPIPTLHLTIMVMHLATDEDVENAKLALRDCHLELGDEITSKKLNICFQGLGHFNNKVVFAKIKDIGGILKTLGNIAETVENCYRIYDIHSTDKRKFNPHLTVMKLSRDLSPRQKGVYRIKPELYRAHSDTLFGNQPVRGLQLCSMKKPKSKDGYYFKEDEVLFNEEPNSSGIIEEEPKEPITEPVSSCIIEEEPKEPITEPVSSDDQAASLTHESQEANEVPQCPDPEPQASPNANTEGDKPSSSEPT